MRTKWNMGFQPYITLVIIAGFIFCGCSLFKKKKSDDDPATATISSTGSVVTNVDDAVVTASTSSLMISAKLSIVPPKGSSSLALADLTGTYDSDESVVFVEEDSMEALAQAETILCYISQTRFETQVNKGPYYAIVDQKQCENAKHNERSGESLSHMKVIATREENKPLIAKGWVREEEQGEKQLIQFILKVAEGSSAKNPLGIFRFNFSFFSDTTGANKGGGLIESYRSQAADTVALRYYMAQEMTEEGSTFNIVEAANSQLTIDGDGNIIKGLLNTKFDYEIWKKGEYKVAFNDNYLAKTGSLQEMSWQTGQLGAPQAINACIDRNSYNSIVYRYGLYKPDGNRKTLNSGFPIEIEIDGEIRHGHVGYYGIWVDGDPTLSNNQAITKVDWSGGQKSEESYTIFKAPGKLYKYTQQTITLGSLAGADLYYWDWDGGGDQYIVHWAGNSEGFQKKQTVTQGPQGEEYQDASGALAAPQWGYNFWVPALSANINIPSDATLSDSLTVTYHAQELVSHSQSSNLTLKCYSRCPKMAAAYDASDNDWGYEAYNTNTNEWDVRISDGPLKSYIFNGSDRNLYDSSQTTAFVAPTATGSSEDAWLSSGVLVTDAQMAGVTDLDISPWELEGSLSEFYRWESSSSSWGKYVAAKNASGQIASFDKPMEFSYTHSQANDYDGKESNSGYGKRFRISYGGFGELWGIPWKSGVLDQEEKPIFSIKTGVTLTGSDGVVYTLKALDVAQLPTAAASENCSASELATSSAPALPTADIVTIVDNGTEPSDAESPIKVIEGELVE